MDLKKRALGALVPAAVFFILACVPPAIKTTMLVPAKYHEASQLKEVAVLPFDGKDGGNFSSEIEATLVSINIGDKQYFSLVDRVKLDKALNEMKLQQSGIIDEKKVARIGKMVGAKGIYTGVITESGSSDSSYRESRQKCTYYATEYDKKGNARQKCVTWQEYTVPCTKRTASFAFTPKLIEVETGRVVYSNNIRGSIDASVCSDSQKPLPSEQELMNEARKSAKLQLRTDIAPYYVTMDIQLMDSPDGITSDAAKAKLTQGINFAKNSRLDRGCEIWGEARTVASSSPSLLYNLGICSEVTGDLEQAADLYKKADKLLMKPDNRITVALARVQKRIDDEKKLKEETSQTVNPTKAKPSGANPSEAAANINASKGIETAKNVNNANAAGESEWLDIKPGEESNNYRLDKDGSVFLGGTKLFKFNRFEGLKLGFSPSKSIAVALGWDYDKGGLDVFVVDVKGKKVIAKDVQHGPLGDRASWSSDERYLLLQIGGEGVGALLSFDLQSGAAKDVPLKKLGKIYGKGIKEVQIADLRRILWLDNHTIQIPIDIYCNIYDDDKCNSKKPRRSYQAKINLQKFEGIYTELQLTK